MKTEKILVVGATGFIGNHLLKKLRGLGYDAVGTSRKGDKSENILPLNITNKVQVDSFLKKKITIVFHLAAFIPKKMDMYRCPDCFSVNMMGTLNLLESSVNHDIKKFVYSSSASIYSRSDTPMPAKEEYASPENVYGLSKLSGESLCQIFKRDFNLNTISLRYSSVYGPGQKQNSVLPIFIDRALKNKNIEIFGKGKRTQDFIFINDVVEANLRAAFSKVSGVFNIGSGKETSLVELARAVRDGFISGCSIKHIVQQKEDESRFVLDITKSRKELGFKPRHSLQNGLEHYRKWYESR